MLRKFESGRAPYDMDIIKETKMGAMTKQLSAVWVFIDRNQPVNFERSRSACNMFL